MKCVHKTNRNPDVLPFRWWWNAR